MYFGYFPVWKLEARSHLNKGAASTLYHFHLMEVMTVS